MQILWKMGALVLAVSLLGLAMCNAHRETLPATKSAGIVAPQPEDMARSTPTVLPATKSGRVLAPPSPTVLPASKAGPVLPPRDTVLPASKFGPVLPPPQPQQQTAQPQAQP